ncbi:MAG TPA: type VI secretion system tube protein Hcp [Vicinamibacterales bacterium]
MRRSRFKALVAAGVVATGIAASTSTVAASDIYLKVTNIRGESTDEKHKGEIDVLSWSWGQSSGSAVIKGGKIPATCIQDLVLVKNFDSSSASFIMMGVTGGVAADAILSMTTSGGDKPLEFLTLHMTNVSVPSYQTGGSGGDSQLTETLVLHFDSIKGEYRTQKPDGTAGESFPFDVAGTCK